MELGLILQEHLAARERILEIARERQPVERRRSPRQIAQHRALLRASHRERLFGLFDQARLFEMADRKSTRLNPATNAQLVCRLLIAKKKHPSTFIPHSYYHTVTQYLHHIHYST